MRSRIVLARILAHISARIRDATSGCNFEMQLRGATSEDFLTLKPSHRNIRKHTELPKIFSRSNHCIATSEDLPNIKITTFSEVRYVFVSCEVVINDGKNFRKFNKLVEIIDKIRHAIGANRNRRQFRAKAGMFAQI